jgi:general secretion pathway protein J
MTLIEVMIALAIFAVISVFTISSTNMGLRIKKKITEQNDQYQTLRTVLRFLDRDISLAFHAFSDTKVGESNRAQAIKTNPLLAIYTPGSFFKGSKDKLFFTSSSHQRMYKDTNETDTCKISYYLEQNPDDQSVDDLIKRESAFIDDKLEESGARYVLASNVKSLSFRYYSPKGITDDGVWDEVWDSTQGERMGTFPMAVEVTIELVSPDNKEKTLKVVEKIKLINPNNIDGGVSASASE